MSPIKYRVMIVDDEEDMRTILKVALSQKYEVFEATNGLDAMLKLEKYQPDVAVVDMMMPLMDGYELSEKIRSTNGFENLPMVALSALNSTKDIKKGYQSGANIYLTKPFRPERVDKNIQVVLEGRAPIRKNIPIEQIEKREKELAESRARAKRKDKSGTGSRVTSQAQAQQKPPVASTAPAGGSSKAPSAVHIPPQPKESRPHTPPQSDVNLKAPTPRIYIVDDDEDFLLIARTSLEKEFEVIVSNNGRDCLNKISYVQPDLFILDGMMPKLSGYQMLDMLHGSNETCNIPIIFASAKSDPRDKKHVMMKGVVKYLVKPFPESALIDAVKNVTGQPGFVCRNKTNTISEVLYREGKERAEAHEISEARKRWETNQKLRNVIKDGKE